MMRGAGTCAPRRLGAVTGPDAPPTQSLSSRPTAVPADAAGAPPPTDEFTSNGRGPAPGTVTGVSCGREREASTFSDPSFAPRCTGTDRHPKERRCLAFRSDAGQLPTIDESEAPRILVPVGRLGRHDDAHQYARKHVTVTCGGSTLQVWLNVTPDAVEGPQPLLRQDEDGEWHVDENVPGHPPDEGTAETEATPHGLSLGDGAWEGPAWPRNSPRAHVCGGRGNNQLL